jgi:excisionase family DNA binding protein
MSLCRPDCPAIVMVMLTATPQMTGPRIQGARVALTRDEVMTASEVAELLHLPVSTVYYLARRGELPASRFGRTWRFLRPRIERLLEE